MICNFNIALTTKNGPNSQEMTYFDFVVEEEHHFLRNIFETDELKLSKKLKNIEVYFDAFDRFVKIITDLINCYTSDNDMEYVEEDYLKLID